MPAHVVVEQGLSYVAKLVYLANTLVLMPRDVYVVERMVNQMQLSRGQARQQNVGMMRMQIST